MHFVQNRLFTLLFTLSQSYIYILEKLEIASENELSNTKVISEKIKNKPVAKHFNLPEHSVNHLQVSILKQTNTNRTGNNDKLKNKSSYPNSIAFKD